MDESSLNKLKAILIDQHLDAILISSPPNLYYTSGFICLSPLEREAYVLITKQQAYLITNPLYAGDTTLPQDILLMKTTENSNDEIITSLLKKHNARKIGFEEDYLSVAEYNSIQLSSVTFVPAHLRNLRIQKTPKEISFIEKACEIGDDAFNFILNKIKPGISEKEIANEMELFIRKNGATLSFPSIIAFGKNGAIPHHVTSNYKIAKNNFLLLDFGVKVNEYCSDMTRTIYVGEPTNEERKMYETVLKAQTRAIEYIQKTQKIQASTVDKISRDYIISQGYPDFPHTLGHGIGLAVHEAPSLSAHSKDEVKKDMVFSIEPGIYLQEKTGIRIEDLVVIEEKEARILTKSPKELILI